MAEQTVSRTALGAAICRLIEQYQPEKSRLFDDPVVKGLVGGPIQWMMRFAGMRNYTVKQTDAVAKGIYGVQVCRTRYIDEAVQAAIAQAIQQLVILGAGLDTRLYRLPGLEKINGFELDLPAAQANKKKKLQKYLGVMPANITFLPIDFETQTLESAFSKTGFNPARPAIFVWEGVTQYVTEEAVRQTLAFIGKLASGSIIVFTYVLKSIIERRSEIAGADHMMDVVAKQSPWIFGMEPSGIQDFLKPYRLALVADVGNSDYQEKYLKPSGRDLIVFEGERIVQAAVR